MARLTVITYPGMKELTGTAATLEDLINTLSPLPRNATVQIPIHVLNALAADNHLKDDQAGLTNRFDPTLKKAYATFVAANSGDVVRPFHPLQQLVFLHAASRYCSGEVGVLTPQDVEQRFTRACVQINDLIPKKLPELRDDTILYLFSEIGSHWDLINNSHPLLSIGRLRHLLLEMPARGGPLGEAAIRLRDRFPEYLGLPFETVFNLSAFLIFWWHLHAKNNPAVPGTCLVDRRTWLTKSTITREEMDTFLDRISTTPEELVKHFDAAKLGMTFQDVMPFRQRPLFKIDDNMLGYICPQFVIEKGGVDLFWLLTNTQPGVREGRPWMDDFGSLIEGYVNDILSSLSAAAIGGRYDAFIEWKAINGTSGEIDGLIHSGEILILIETKASLVRQAVLSSGDEGQVREEMERKFVVGDGTRHKGLSQLARTLDWLAVERKHGRTFHNIDLSAINWIIPVLVVADRSLRFPPLARWFDRRFGSLLKRSWGRIGPLVLCSLEDLESMEQRAVDGYGSVVATLAQYAQDSPKTGYPLSEFIGRHRNRRLLALADGWIEELTQQKVLPLE